jgi:class 3 adenylate cyclase
MPVYLDIHNLEGVTGEQVTKAHLADHAVQSKYGVDYIKYWFNENHGKIFCLCNAPSAEAAIRVHQDSHGLLAEKIIEVEPELLEGFLGGGEDSASGAVMLSGSAERDPGIRTVLFTDIVGSTTMTQQLGDEAAMDLLRVHDTIVREALAASKGREIKHTGDGIMASFVSATSAVRCATRIQRALAQYGNERRDYPLKVRIGAAAGEPVEHNNDIFGSTVQLAARLCAKAEPEQIMVSNVVAELCIGKGLPFQEQGDVALKGFDRPVRVHVVNWSGEDASR